MTVPWTGPGLSPLQLYLREEQAGLAFITVDLSDAAADAQRRLHALAGKDGIGATVRRAQLSAVRKNLLVTQHALWQAVGRRVRQVSPRVAAAAAEAQRAVEEVLFRRAGMAVPPALMAAQQGYAERTVVSYLARSAHHVPLSRQVFRTQALTNGWVDRTINRVLLQGGSWKELADRVRRLIQPETAGGISYAAKRLARTELNNAFHTASVATSAQNPFTIGMTWHLSGSHPRPDRCDELARGHSPGLSPGVYAHGEVPDKPHPQCLCYVASVPMNEDDFLADVLSGSRDELLAISEKEFSSPDAYRAARAEQKRASRHAREARRRAEAISPEKVVASAPSRPAPPRATPTPITPPRLSPRSPLHPAPVQRPPASPRPQPTVTMTGGTPEQRKAILEVFNHATRGMPDSVRQSLTGGIHVATGTELSEHAMAEYRPNQKSILYRASALLSDSLPHEATGWYSPSGISEPGLRTMTHELGHHLYRSMIEQPGGIQRGITLFQQIADVMDLPISPEQSRAQWMRQHADSLVAGVGAYAAKNWDELIAELWTEWRGRGTAASGPAQLVGQYLEAVRFS